MLVYRILFEQSLQDTEEGQPQELLCSNLQTNLAGRQGGSKQRGGGLNPWVGRVNTEGEIGGNFKGVQPQGGARNVWLTCPLRLILRTRLNFPPFLVCMCTQRCVCKLKCVSVCEGYVYMLKSTYPEQPCGGPC